ncbi:hypothetical protein MES4922_360024 [Mesorhizobium ventifaucium]|uniref:Uncharacterized protein n=1 Tax=Mesorhizobium ventifaucium TaxID=666020 RepID=A0ABM9E6B4_9HYPH|nr:hypothetical protein MES4922_360024 [Mesorhizobium ventifaucium]
MENRNCLRLRVRPMAVNNGEWRGAPIPETKTRLIGRVVAQIRTMNKFLTQLPSQSNENTRAIARGMRCPSSPCRALLRV